VGQILTHADLMKDVIKGRMKEKNEREETSIYIYIRQRGIIVKLKKSLKVST